MEGQIVFVFVEGPDDTTFFQRVVEPYLDATRVKYLEYAEEFPEYVEERINGLESEEMPDHVDYIFLTDKDDFEEKEDSIDDVVQDYPQINRDKVQVVALEIESWYFAGLKEESCQALNIPYFEDTADKNKRDFMSMLSDDLYRSSNFKESFLVQITTKFCLEEAKTANSSFEEFCQHVDL